MPIKKFADAEILTADEVNTYLMDQVVVVFDSETARNNAFSSEDPALPSRGDGGRLCYIKSTQKIQFWSGTEWVDSSQFSVSQNSQVTQGVLQLDRLVSGTSGQIIVANSSGVPTYVTLSGDATISNTGVLSIGANNVALGTDTTGNYVATITGGVGITSTAATSGEGTTHSLSIGQDVATSASPTFADMTLTGSASVDGSLYVTGNAVYNMSIASVANSASITSTSSGKFIEAGTSASVAGTVYVTGSGWDIGAQVTIMQMGTGSASISFPGQALKGTPITGTTAVLRTQFSSVTLINRAENDWFVIGDLKL